MSDWFSINISDNQTINQSVNYFFPPLGRPGAYYGGKDISDSERFGETGLALLAVGDGLQKMVDFYDFQVVVAQADGRTGIEVNMAGCAGLL